MIGLLARIELARARLLAVIQGLDETTFPAWAIAIELAWQDGSQMACDSEDPQPSMLIAEEPDLLTAFMDGFSNARTAREQELRIAQEQVRTQEAQSLIQQARWTDLGLPEPSALAQRILQGENVKINGHSLYFEDGYTWYTNPYGQDGVLGGQPTIDLLTRFLTNMARDIELGPVPY